MHVPTELSEYAHLTKSNWNRVFWCLLQWAFSTFMYSMEFLTVRLPYTLLNIEFRI